MTQEIPNNRRANVALDFTLFIIPVQKLRKGGDISKLLHETAAASLATD